jgi:mRNA interferase MazF
MGSLIRFPGCGYFDGKKGQIVIDQIRTIDRERLVKRLGRLPDTTLQTVLSVLREMFSL